VREIVSSQGRSVSLVPFLFGVAQRAELPGVGLTRLLGDFGLSEAAARALLLRMRQEGQVDSVRRGRGAGYRLAGEYGRRFHRIRAADRAAPPAWDGSFHALLYQVPESSRAFRDALRRAAVGLGYGQLQPGVLIALEDRSALLTDPPPDAQLFVSRLAMDLPDAARAARVAWDLDELARAFAGHAAALRAALADLAEPPEPSRQALIRYADLLKTPMTETLRSPRLPAELLPEGWPMPGLWRAIGEVQRIYGPAAAAYVTTVLDAA
jgi:phenylacetic acid degradation operon negative regulatory protein